MVSQCSYDVKDVQIIIVHDPISMSEQFYRIFYVYSYVRKKHLEKPPAVLVLTSGTFCNNYN